MKEFSSSTKVLVSFADSPQIRGLTRLFGDRLSGLTRLEKYQLVAAIGELLMNIADDEENEEYGISFSNTTDITQCRPLSNRPLSKNAVNAIDTLKGEDPANLAAILAPIAEYAREDDREDDGEDDDLGFSTRSEFDEDPNMF